MALLERVATLLRANINDLIDKAEDPEKMLKQLILDMENQLLQVKTQVAIAIADQHLLEKKKLEHQEATTTWKEKASLAVQKQRDDLAREALGRSLSHTQMASGFAQQVEDQSAEVDLLRSTFLKLQAKLTETRHRCDLLIAQHRRARAVGKAHQAQGIIDTDKKTASIDRFKSRIQAEEASNHAEHVLENPGSLEDRFALLEREQQIQALLEDLKSKQARSA